MVRGGLRGLRGCAVGGPLRAGYTSMRRFFVGSLGAGLEASRGIWRYLEASGDRCQKSSRTLAGPLRALKGQ